MLPTLADGTPLCLMPRFAKRPLAWPKLWKHHGRRTQTDRINAVAREQNEPWLKRYGGTSGSNGSSPRCSRRSKMTPTVYDAAEVWLEAGDWFVWQLVGGRREIRCRARPARPATKGMWTAEDGFPSRGLSRCR